jgi:fatty-acyl-CoA synthase
MRKTGADFHGFLPPVERIRARVTTIRKYILITDKPDKPDLKWVDTGVRGALGGRDAAGRAARPRRNTLATQSYTTGDRPAHVYLPATDAAYLLVVWLTGSGNNGGVGDVYMPLTPVFHVHAWGVPYLMTLLGVKQVYPGKYEPEMLMKLLLKEQVTFSHCVPTILQMIVSAQVAQKVDLSKWKVIIGGARLPKGLALAATKLGIKVWAGYGMSETCPILTLAHLKPFMETWDADKQLDVSISTGFPILW